MQGTQDNNPPFLQIDLGTNFVLCAVATQGNSQAEEWVETYQLQTSNDGMNWKDYKEEGEVSGVPNWNLDEGFGRLYKTMTLFKTKNMSFSYCPRESALIVDSVQEWTYVESRICRQKRQLIVIIV